MRSPTKVPSSGLPWPGRQEEADLPNLHHGEDQKEDDDNDDNDDSVESPVEVMVTHLPNTTTARRIQPSPENIPPPGDGWGSASVETPSSSLQKSTILPRFVERDRSLLSTTSSPDHLNHTRNHSSDDRVDEADAVAGDEAGAAKIHAAVVSSSSSPTFLRKSIMVHNLESDRRGLSARDDGMVDADEAGAVDETDPVGPQVAAAVTPPLSLSDLPRVSSCYFSIHSNPTTLSEASNSVADLLSLWASSNNKDNNNNNTHSRSGVRTPNQGDRDEDSDSPFLLWDEAEFQDLWVMTTATTMAHPSPSQHRSSWSSSSTSPSSPHPPTVLYHDLLIQVMSYLNLADLRALSETARCFHQAAADYLLWQLQQALRRGEHEFDPERSGPTPEPPSTSPEVTDSGHGREAGPGLTATTATDPLTSSCGMVWPMLPGLGYITRWARHEPQPALECVEKEYLGGGLRRRGAVGGPAPPITTLATTTPFRLVLDLYQTFNKMQQQKQQQQQQQRVPRYSTPGGRDQQRGQPDPGNVSSGHATSTTTTAASKQTLASAAALLVAVLGAASYMSHTTATPLADLDMLLSFMSSSSTSAAELSNMLLKVGVVGSLMGAAQHMSKPKSTTTPSSSATRERSSMPALLERAEQFARHLQELLSTQLSHPRRTDLRPGNLYAEPNTSAARAETLAAKSESAADSERASSFDDASVTTSKESRPDREDTVDLLSLDGPVEGVESERTVWAPFGCVGVYWRTVLTARLRLQELRRNERRAHWESLPVDERRAIATSFIDACSSDEFLPLIKEMVLNGPKVNVEEFHVGSSGTETCGLHAAAFHGACRVIEFLCNGVDADDPQQDGASCPVDITDANGWTALHFAAGANSVEAVRILVSYGADLSVEASNGYTPLQWAERLQHHAVAEELRQALSRAPSLPVLRGGTTHLHEPDHRPGSWRLPAAGPPLSAWHRFRALIPTHS